MATNMPSNVRQHLICCQVIMYSTAEQLVPLCESNPLKFHAYTIANIVACCYQSRCSASFKNKVSSQVSIHDLFVCFIKKKKVSSQVSIHDLFVCFIKKKGIRSSINT